MDFQPLLIILLSIIAGLTSSYLTYFYSQKSKKQQAILKFKEEKYGNMVILLQAFFDYAKSAPMKRRFLEESYKSWLYCSDNVINAINAFIKFMEDARGKTMDHEKGKALIGNIILEMRRDLLGKTDLTSTDFRYIKVPD